MQHLPGAMEFSVPAQLTVFVPEEVKEKLEAHAKENGRTLEQEIRAALVIHACDLRISHGL